MKINLNQISEIFLMRLSPRKLATSVMIGLLVTAGPALSQVEKPLPVTGTSKGLTAVQLTLPRDTLLDGMKRVLFPGNVAEMARDTSKTASDTLYSRLDSLLLPGDTLRIGGDTLVVRDSLTNRLDTLALDTSAARRDTLAANKDTLDIITSVVGLNTLPGFRVQVLSTQNLMEAINAKAKADSLLKSYNVYIVYDSPYYKVRVGDFHARYEANRAVNFIADHGFPDAWPVPDNIFRNPPKRNAN